MDNRHPRTLDTGVRHLIQEEKEAARVLYEGHAFRSVSVPAFPRFQFEHLIRIICMQREWPVMTQALDPHRTWVFYTDGSTDVQPFMELQKCAFAVVVDLLQTDLARRFAADRFKATGQKGGTFDSLLSGLVTRQITGPNSSPHWLLYKPMYPVRSSQTAHM